MIKRILSFILALSLTASVSATAHAAEIEITEDMEIFPENESTDSTESTEFVFSTQTEETQESADSLISVEETISDSTEDSTIPTTIPTEVTTPSTEATEPTNSTEEPTTEPTESSTIPTTQPETEPTQPSTTPEDYVTEPTNPSEDITDKEPSEPLIPTVLEIDTENIYEGMTKAYKIMKSPIIFDSEYQFCLLLWESEPIRSMDLVRLCKNRINWSKSTTYTVIRRLSERGIVEINNTIVRSLMSKQKIQDTLLKEFVETYFNSSLDDFLDSIVRIGTEC